VADIEIHEFDETYVKLVIPNKGIQMELSDHLTFDSPKQKWSKNKRYWDGKIRLYNRITHKVYAGLCSKIVDFAREKKYSLKNHTEYTTENNVTSIDPFLTASTFELRDYQKEAVLFAIRKKRALLVCPTASGKSMIAYQIHKIFENMNEFRNSPFKTLLIVPTINLVRQMESDFRSYGYVGNIQFIMGGETKIIYPLTNIVISTWQSIYEMDKSFFHNFNVIIGDEAHTFKAKSLIEIMQNANHIKYRFGMTGTLDGIDVHQLMLEGLFGEIYKPTTTDELIQKKQLSPLKIHALVLKHQKNKYSGSDYMSEVDYLNNKRERNGFICNLAKSLSGKTLILFAQREHGQELLRILNAKGVSNCFYIDGTTPAAEREGIRSLMISSPQDMWLLGSYGTCSTGMNIPTINNMIFASSTKSRIRLMQSIGRGLRLNPNKEMCNIYDITDNLQMEPTNHTLKHFIERISMYNEESFPYKIHTINLREEGSDAILY